MSRRRRKTPEEWTAERVERYAVGLAAIDAGGGPPWAPELAAAIRAGETAVDFAARTEHSKSRCYDLLNDPYGEKARVRKGTYTCARCGEERAYDGGLNPPVHCIKCEPIVRAEDHRERVIAAIQLWDAMYGRPPTAADWNTGQWSRMKPEEERHAAVRWSARRWPPTSSVQAAFGSWNAAIAAAGYEPMQTGHRRGR
jgi:HNH endonuclease